MISTKFAAVINSGIAALLFTLFAATPASSSGSSTTTALAAQQRADTAEHFITNALRVWQNRMGLDDWDIQVNMVRANNLEPKTLGNIHWDTDVKRATIDVLSPYDYTLSTPAMLNDMEVTVVHELVHLQLATLPRSDATRGQEEQAVVRITRALLNLSKR
jgi:hypothetical protein